MKLNYAFNVFVMFVLLSIYNSCGPGGANDDNTPLVSLYDIETIESNETIEIRLYYDANHFLTMTNNDGVLEIHPHPGTASTDTGSIWFAQPYFSGAILGHTTTTTPLIYQDGISIKAMGQISRGADQGAGLWSMELFFSYDMELHLISGTGQMGISVTDDILYDHVFLYKIKSLYLNDIVLLPLNHQSSSTKITGDTGWMQKLKINGTDEWIPDQQSILENRNINDMIYFQLSGDYFRPDTSAYGHDLIESTYNPDITIRARSENTMMGYRCDYDIAHQQEIGSTNVEIAPLIVLHPNINNYSVSIEFKSRAIEYLDGKSQTNAGQSCANILNKNLSWGDGIYWVDLDQNNQTIPTQVYCDMTDDGGGWMLYAAINSPQDFDQISAADYQQGRLNPDLEHINTGNWILPASQFSNYIQVMRLNMGDVKDFYIPRSGISFESMLISSNRHLWHSTPTGPFIQPVYADTGLGGSAYLWPRDNVDNDNRSALSFWGSDNNGGSGGCCSLSYVYTDYTWGRAFKLWVR
jgi:hypothetical protein